MNITVIEKGDSTMKDFGGRMYYPKADYLEEVKAITSYIKN